MLCYVMLCYVMLCYVMLCYVMLCFTIVLVQIKVKQAQTQVTSVAYVPSQFECVLKMPFRHRGRRGGGGRGLKIIKSY